VRSCSPEAARRFIRPENEDDEENGDQGNYKQDFSP
jgi:hypothetical protein